MHKRYGQTPYGLSPRVRGNQTQVCGRIGCSGSIPACAGEPPLSRRDHGKVEVYPRVCGGTAPRVYDPLNDSGLSPRVRGNPPTPTPPIRPPGSIPACAGEPAILFLHRPIIQVYPRVCGGTRRHQPPIFAGKGLSPRVRGNLMRTARPFFTLRSIPACAGEPTSSVKSQVNDMVYPRVCGGTTRRTTIALQITGLSPRVRGNQPF